MPNAELNNQLIRLSGELDGLTEDRLTIARATELLSLHHAACNLVRRIDARLWPSTSTILPPPRE